MRGLEVPPRTADFTADPVELFFDLSYVFAFSQLVARFLHEPTLVESLRTGLLFLLIWLPWTQFHWSANAVSGNSRLVRAWFLVGTVAAIPMGASIETAYTTGGPVFAISSAVILAMGLATMILGLERDNPVSDSIRTYAVPNWVAMAIILVAAFLPDPFRTAGWVLGILVVLVFGMLRAGRQEWLVRAGHFAERHGLIVIIALGEVIVATGLGVAQVVDGGEDGAATLPGAATLLALVAAGVFAGLLWWSYFDRPLPAWEHGADRLGGRARGRFARDVWSLWHAPIVLGIVLAAAGLEEVTLHPEEPLPVAFRVMLAVGMVGFLGGIVGAVWRAFRVVGWERLLVLAIVVVVVLALPVPGAWLVVLADVVLLAGLVVEARRSPDEPTAVGA